MTTYRSPVLPPCRHRPGPPRTRATATLSATTQGGEVVRLMTTECTGCGLALFALSVDGRPTGEWVPALHLMGRISPARGRL